MKVKEDNCNFGMLELLLDAIGILSEKYVKNEANARCLCFLCEYPTFYRAIYKEITYKRNGPSKTFKGPNLAEMETFDV